MNDDDLRESFRSLKREDSRTAPAFRTMWRRPRARSPWRLFATIAPLTAAAAVLVVWCATRQPEPSSSPMVATATSPGAVAPLDPGPLDFLLEMPVTAALSGTPDFDSNPLTRRSRR